MAMLRDRKRNRRMDFMLIVIWLMVHEPQFVAGLVFTLSSSRVLLGTTGTLKMTCNVTETDASVIYNIQIRHQTGPGSTYTWETLAEIEAGLFESPVLDENIVNDKDFVAGGNLDKVTPINTYLTLDMNKEKLKKNDTRDYRCELTYKSNDTGRVVSIKRDAYLSVVDENDEDDEHDETLSVSVESLEYVNKTTLVIVLGFIAVILLVYACVITVWRKKTTGRSDDNLQYIAGQELLSVRETDHLDNTIQDTVISTRDNS